MLSFEEEALLDEIGTAACLALFIDDVAVAVAVVVVVVVVDDDDDDDDVFVAF